MKRISLEDDDDASIKSEMKMMRQCGDHSNIVNFYGKFTQDNGAPENAENDIEIEDGISYWLVMELCVCSALDIIERLQKPFSERQAACIIRDALHALEHLHSLKMIHRDVKAANLLLTQDGRTKVADFGVSANLSITSMKRWSVVGTPYHMAPEVIAETGYGPAADVWSIGITAIELVQGHTPLHNIHPMRALFKIAAAPPPTLDEPSKYSPQLNDFIKACLQVLAILMSFHVLERRQEP